MRRKTAKTPHAKPPWLRQKAAAKKSRSRRPAARQAQPQQREQKPAPKLEGYFMTSRRGYGFVRTRQPGWPDIFIAANNTADARQYDHVLIKLLTPTEGKSITPESRLEGVVLRVLHHLDEADLVKNDGQDMQMVMWQLGAPGDFPAAVLAEAAAVPQQVSSRELAGRRDYRDLPFVTIDGADSRDFDDAVYCRREANGNFFLSVQIADVSHYVWPGSALEQEAFARAASVYLPDRVLPMLPQELSNGICSLNAGVDRLTLGCDMEFTPRGRLVSYEIFPAVINVFRRLDYDGVNALLLGDKRRLSPAERELLPLLQPLAALQGVLEKSRSRRGALNFDFPELKVQMAADGSVAAICQRRQRLAEKMIEQAMLAANETVAAHFHRLRLPFVYRVHQGPQGEKLAALNAALLAFDYGELSGGDEVSPREVQRLLRRAAGRPEDEFIQLMTLRSMSHAEYSPDCTGHFGLAAKYYCHFTSPIRRYADLAVHRAVKHELMTADDRFSFRKPGAYMAAAARQASERERAAEELEREAVKMKCCLYMRGHIGEVFPGKVSGVTPGGVFVALENGVEGRVAVDELPPDEYNYYAETMLLKGRRQSFTLGTPLTVRVAKVDLPERRIDFVPA